MSARASTSVPLVCRVLFPARAGAWVRRGVCARVFYKASIWHIRLGPASYHFKSRARARAKPFTFSLAPNPNARVAIYHAHQFETVPEITPLHLLSASIHSIHTRLRDRRSAHNVLRSGRKTEGPHRRFPVYPYLVLFFNTVSQYLFFRPPDKWFPVSALSHRSGLRRTRSSAVQRRRPRTSSAAKTVQIAAGLDADGAAGGVSIFSQHLEDLGTPLALAQAHCGARPSALWRSYVGAVIHLGGYALRRQACIIAAV